MDATSNLEKVEGNNGKASMEASSPILDSAAKPNTSKTLKLTPEQMLEVLADLLAKYQQIGGEVRSINHENSAVVVLDNVKIESGKFVPLNL